MHMSDWSSDVCSSDLSAPPPATANLPALTISVATLGALPPDYESLTPDLPKARPPSPPALLARLPEIRSHLPPAPAAATEPRRRKAGTRCWSHHARPRSEEHTSELQSLMRISYAVFCLKKKTLMTPNAYIHITK